MYGFRNIANLVFFSIISSITWSQVNVPPTLTATGNQAYCPLSKLPIVSSFNIIDPDDTQIEELSIQISSGYVIGQDILELQLPSNHPNISTIWSPSEGKLTLRSSSSGLVDYTDLIAAVMDITFQNSSIAVSGTRTFSFTIGDTNFLPATGHFYEFVASIGIPWSDAKTLAESRTYFGLKGYLATITSREEALFIGIQAPGTGWIGGSDQETEGVWKWVTGPEAGTIFWNGGASGSSPNFAFWNNGEPNNLGNEDFAHVTAPNVGISGSWNDLRNTGEPSGDYQPKGYIVEYGGSVGDPVLNISTNTHLFIPQITSVATSSRCGDGSLIVSATASHGDILWFDSELGGTPIFTGQTYTTPSLSNGTTTYYVLASVNGCHEGLRTPVEAIVNEIPVALTSFEFKNCDEDGNPDGFTNFNLTEANSTISLGNSNVSITYHLSIPDANDRKNAVNATSFNNATAQRVYARVENTSGCFSLTTVDLAVSTTAFPAGFSYEMTACDDTTVDGLQTFDLTQATSSILTQFPSNQNLVVQYYRSAMDAQLEQNEILPQNSYTNETAFSQTLFVRVESADNGNCFGIGAHLLLTVYEKPVVTVEPTATLCLNSGPIVIGIKNPVNTSLTYEWFDPNGSVISTDASVSVATGGAYQVVATSSRGCTSFTEEILVIESNIASITQQDIDIVDDSNNNTITINAGNNNLGIGDYEFALDNISGPYQDSSQFTNVSQGIHTIYIRDKNACGIINIDVTVVGFPKFFTPNNDGFNDTWSVKGISDTFFSSAEALIFNRFGKLILKIDLLTNEWDGKYRGKILDNTDYWYTARLVDKNGAIRIKKGHFSLVKR